MMLLHIALQVLLEYRHTFNSEENAVPCSFLLQLLCIPAETSPVLNLRTFTLPQPAKLMVLETQLLLRNILSKLLRKITSTYSMLAPFTQEPTHVWWRSRVQQNSRSTASILFQIQSHKSSQDLFPHNYIKEYRTSVIAYVSVLGILNHLQLGARILYLFFLKYLETK